MDNENQDTTSNETKQDTIKDNPGDNTNDNAQPNQNPPATFSTPDFDVAELTRKLDGIIESQSVISKAIAQMITSGSSRTTEPTSTTRPNPDALPCKDINELDL